MQQIAEIIRADHTLRQIASLPIPETVTCEICQAITNRLIRVLFYEKYGQWLCDICEKTLFMQTLKQDRQKHPEKYLPACGFVGDDLQKSFENFVSYKDKIQEFIDYANGKQLGNLFLTSKINGNGKSHIAKAIIRRLVQRGVSPHKLFFISAYNLLLEIRSTYDRNGEPFHLTEKDLLGIYSQKELLVIDDLGAEKISDYSVATLTSLIDNRLRFQKSTIITSNLSLEQIGEKLSSRLASRLSSFKICEFQLPDYRKKYRRA